MLTSQPIALKAEDLILELSATEWSLGQARKGLNSMARCSFCAPGYLGVSRKSWRSDPKALKGEEALPLLYENS
jgi:hypothetical protein